MDSTPLDCDACEEIDSQVRCVSAAASTGRAQWAKSLHSRAGRRVVGTHQGLAGAQVEQHVVDDGHVRLRLKAHDVGSLLGQGGATSHVHVVTCGERQSEGW